MRVELIGPVFGETGTGPYNGMFALQRELRVRISEGLEWLSIESKPTCEKVIPWYWNWGDRDNAAAWGENSLPFLMGPNVLPMNAKLFPLDNIERSLLNTESCRAIFCHSEWIRDLIIDRKGPNSRAEIWLWPYPIYPLPEGPLETEHDLLIYVKSGHTPELVNNLKKAYPKNIVIHYGGYLRHHLYEAARVSRVCVHLSEIEGGSMATQEIMLSGCPVVGTHRGSPLIQEIVTGFYTDSLLLDDLLAGIKKATYMDRDFIREEALKRFSTKTVVDNLISILERVRK